MTCSKINYYARDYTQDYGKNIRTALLIHDIQLLRELLRRIREEVLSAHGKPSFSHFFGNEESSCVYRITSTEYYGRGLFFVVTNNIELYRLRCALVRLLDLCNNSKWGGNFKTKKFKAFSKQGFVILIRKFQNVLDIMQQQEKFQKDGFDPENAGGITLFELVSFDRYAVWKDPWVDNLINELSKLNTLMLTRKGRSSKS